MNDSELAFMVACFLRCGKTVKEQSWVGEIQMGMVEKEGGISSLLKSRADA